MTETRRILVTGSVGQVGSDLVAALRARHGAANVIATGHRTPPPAAFRDAGPFEFVDTTDAAAMRSVVERHGVDTVYHLAVLLSARAEQEPQLAWSVNLLGLKIVLDLAVELPLRQVFWPSSIAVFGPTSPRQMTPQHTIMEPTTIYGVTKLAGEHLCAWYHRKYGIDVRSIRYPGLVSYRAFSGGGTTDYSVEMFFEARKHGHTDVSCVQIQYCRCFTWTTRYERRSS